MFSQFDVSFCDLYLLHPTSFFLHICKNYKIGLDEKCVGGGGSGSEPPAPILHPLASPLNALVRTLV